MKRKDSYQLRYENSLATSRFVKKLKRKGKKYNPNKKTTKRGPFGGQLIKAPRMISIYNFSKEHGDLFSETVRFMNEIRRYVGRKKCVIDFSETEHISAAAMIVVYASIEVALEKGSEKSIIIWSETAPFINRIIKKTNLQHLIERRHIKYNFKDLQTLPVITGTGSQHMDDIVDHIQQQIFDNEMSPETEYVYGDAVSETINNVRLHAYPALSDENKKWWLMCTVRDGELYLAIYDQGVGIPKTVLDKPWILTSMEKVYPDEYNAIKEQFPELEASGLKAYIPKKIEDSKLIYLSMQGDISGTKKSKHGQGSKSINALVNDTDDGKLWIFSNNGLYTFDEEQEGHQISKLPKTLPGTLVQWNIKLT